MAGRDDVASPGDLVRDADGNIHLHSDTHAIFDADSDSYAHADADGGSKGAVPAVDTSALMG